jgi:hypothetical protein
MRRPCSRVLAGEPRICENPFPSGGQPTRRFTAANPTGLLFQPLVKLAYKAFSTLGRLFKTLGRQIPPIFQPNPENSPFLLIFSRPVKPL